MLRVSLIGPGDVDFHFYKFLGFSKKKLQSELGKIAKSLVESEVELELAPDRGISFELAKEYKKLNGKTVIASVPKSDKGYGIKHLEPYLKTKVDGKKLFDKEVDTGDWRQQNRLKALLGDVVLYLGGSAGADLEANYGIYLFKLMNKFKKGISNAKYLHPEVRAGKNIPYTYFVYAPFFKSKKLSSETEAYMKKYKINLVYVKSAKELGEKIRKLKR